MQNHKVYVNDKDLYQMLIVEERYCFRRDNGAVISFRIHLERYLQNLSESWKRGTAEQLIEEIIETLKVPELSGAYKHRYFIYDKDRDAYKVNFISDFEYQKHLDYYLNLGNESCVLSTASRQVVKTSYVESEVSFEDEEYWRKLIDYLAQFVGNDFIPYNDQEKKFYEWTQHATKIEDLLK